MTLNHWVRNVLRDGVVQSPHFGIEATEVKRKISDLSEFVHLVSDRAKSRTLQVSHWWLLPLMPSLVSMLMKYTHLSILWCEGPRLCQWKKRPEPAELEHRVNPRWSRCLSKGGRESAKWQDVKRSEQWRQQMDGMVGGTRQAGSRWTWDCRRALQDSQQMGTAGTWDERHCHWH